MAKRKRKLTEMEKLPLPKRCECCGERDGSLNSRFLNSRNDTDEDDYDPDCGDWVCCECEQEAEIEHNEMEHPPYG